VRNVTSFSYLPRLDHQRLAPRLGRAIAATCRAARSPQVDVVAHSPGGLVARYLIETGDGGLVRRLVTLGAPYYTARILPQELAIFAAQDPLVAAPHPTYGPRGRVVVVPRCGHFGLLYHPAVLDEVARFLSAARDERAPAVAA
jgi:pimeloyl-ACP methyl ester carboxylesterase